MKEISNKLSLVNGMYIYESEVLDVDTNNKYYVVVCLKHLLYATFASSYIDYKLGKGEEPTKIEGDNYLWFDLFTDRGETRFRSFYLKGFEAVSNSESDKANRNKYSHLKKPVNNFKYEVENKDQRVVHGCGPISDIYEIKVHVIDNDTYLYVFADDYAYCIANESVFKALDEGRIVDWIEEIHSFSKAKKSYYYDLYLEMEKYKDNYYEK